MSTAIEIEMQSELYEQRLESMVDDMLPFQRRILDKIMQLMFWHWLYRESEIQRMLDDGCPNV